MRECAKPWAEADADVCEAIDFLEYYARGAIALDGRRARCSSCPASATRCATRRAASSRVIAPWNFPLAIPCGMTAAGARDRQRGRAQARRAGAGAARYALVEALRAAASRRRARAAARRGRRRRRARRRPARAHDRLHRLLRRSASRSCATAAEIAARPAPPQARRRRDGRQELRDRRRRRRPRRGRPRARQVRLRLRRPEVLGRRRACSCHEAIADALVERLAGAVDALLRSARPSGFGIDVPPVIEREPRRSASRATPPRRERRGRLAAQRRATCPAAGWFAAPDARRPTCPPTRRSLQRGDLRPAARRRARARRRGRVRPRRRARRSRSPAACSPATRDTVDRVIDAHARSATSTSTARSPARWSAASRSAATGCPAPAPKAGGPDYLLQFVEPRVVTENTMRHGLVV